MNLRLALVFLVACSSRQTGPSSIPSPEELAVSAPAVQSPAVSATASDVDATASTDEPNWLKVHAWHTDYDRGSVDVVFDRVEVIRARFDPTKVEGGTAEVEISVASLSSGVDMRDVHLKSSDYLDADKFPAATVRVDNVKKVSDNQYTADLAVTAHDVAKTFSSTFAVVATTADSIRVRGQVDFSRLDFKIGKADGDTVKPELQATYELTLKSR